MFRTPILRPTSSRLSLRRFRPRRLRRRCLGRYGPGGTGGAPSGVRSVDGTPWARRIKKTWDWLMCDEWDFFLVRKPTDFCRYLREDFKKNYYIWPQNTEASGDMSGPNQGLTNLG